MAQRGISNKAGRRTRSVGASGSGNRYGFTDEEITIYRIQDPPDGAEQ